jgi:hypothetical protein
MPRKELGGEQKINLRIALRNKQKIHGIPKREWKSAVKWI